jgi:hypothetical protein
MAADDVQQFLKRAAEVRLARCTPAQRERRELVTRRNEAIARGVVRGPNAPKDGTFGGVRKS